MGLVHQNADAPSFVHHQAVQQRVDIEKMVVVPHHHVAPAQHFLPQVIGAHGMGQRQGAQGLPVQHVGRGSRQARPRQTVVKTLRQRTGFTMALLVGMFTGLVARHQFQHTQRPTRCAVLDALHRIQRKPAAGGFGSQEKHLVQTLAGNRLQHREQGRHRLANAGGCLGQQAAARQIGLEDGFGERTLAGAKFRMRKNQRAQRCIPLCSVRELLLRPLQETLTHGLEKPAQRVGFLPLAKNGFLRRVDIEVHQCNVDSGQTQVLAQQPRIDASLTPMQMPVVRRHLVERPAVRLDFFQAIEGRVVAVGTAAYR